MHTTFNFDTFCSDWKIKKYANSHNTETRIFGAIIMYFKKVRYHLITDNTKRMSWEKAWREWSNVWKYSAMPGVKEVVWVTFLKIVWVWAALNEIQINFNLTQARQYFLSQTKFSRSIFSVGGRGKLEAVFSMHVFLSYSFVLCGKRRSFHFHNIPLPLFILSFFALVKKSCLDYGERLLHSLLCTFEFVGAI